LRIVGTIFVLRAGSSELLRGQAGKNRIGKNSFDLDKKNKPFKMKGDEFGKG
jgi:hypothetical protein